MQTGHELLSLRERLLEYLYQKGVVSRRVAMHLSELVEFLGIATFDCMVICDMLVEIAFIKAVTPDGEAVESAESLAEYSYIWLTEQGFQYVYSKQAARNTLDTEIAILKEKLVALVRVKQQYSRNLNTLVIQKARYVYPPVDLINQIDEVKNQLADVEPDIDDTVQQLQRLQP